MLNSSYLNALVGRKVAVWSVGQQGTKDEGVLEGFDGVVVKLRKGADASAPEILLFPIQTVRLIKALE